MEILINLRPPVSAYGISYRVMNWATFPIRIPVVVDIGLNMDSHIENSPKECKNLGRSNRFPGKLIMGVVKSAVLSS